MQNSVDSLIHSVGQVIWELRITGSTAGDTLLDVPTSVKKKHRIYGIFRHGTRELFENIGTQTDGDAVVFTRERVTLTSQIEHSDVVYEMTEEIVVEPYLAGMGYLYILHRYPRRTVAT